MQHLAQIHAELGEHPMRIRAAQLEAEEERRRDREVRVAGRSRRVEVEVRAVGLAEHLGEQLQSATFRRRRECRQHPADERVRVGHADISKGDGPAGSSRSAAPISSTVHLRSLSNDSCSTQPCCQPMWPPITLKT